MRNRERHSTQSTVNPDIASTTHELKAIHAQPSVIPPEANKDKTRRLGHAPIVGTLALAITLGVGAFIGTRGGESQPTPERTEPTQSAPAVPGTNDSESSAPSPEVESELDKYGISAAEYSTFEEVATAWTEKIDEYLASSSDTYDEPGDPNYLDAIYGSDWQSNPELSANVTYLQETSVIVSTNHFATGENGTTEYNSSTEVTKVWDVEESEDEVSGYVTFHDTDNIMDTVLAMNNTENLDVYSDWHYTFKKVGDRWQVAELDRLDNN